MGARVADLRPAYACSTSIEALVFRYDGRMTSGAQFREAICRDPSDMASRLVYSDWLMEQDNPLGEFIANHCRLEEMSGLEEGYSVLLAATNRLEAKHAATWLEAYLKRVKASERFSRVAVDTLFNPEFRHGFLHRIAGQLEDVEAHWSWLREREPVQGMELLVGEGIGQEHRSLAVASEWRSLKVSPDGWFTANSVGDVLRWGFPELLELDLSGCSLGVDGCRLLANLPTDLPDVFDDWTAPPPLPEGQLKALVLSRCAIGDEGAEILLAANTLSALEELGISQCKVELASTLERMKGSARLGQLQTLSIAGNKALGGQLGTLAGWHVLPRLKALALPLSATEGDLAALFPTPSTCLRELNLSSAKELLKTPKVVTDAATNLTALNIGSSRIGDTLWPELLLAPSMSKVVDLRANGCSLSDKGVAALVSSGLDRLVRLDLSSNKLTDASLALLAEWQGLACVTHLRIGNNRKVTAAGYQALIESPYFAPTHLDIGKSEDEALLAALRERFETALYVG